MNDNEIREKLAAAQHEIWASWMEYLFSICIPVSNKNGIDMIIPDGYVKHWRRQINTPYNELSDIEKESDRDQADKVLEAMSDLVTDNTMLREALEDYSQALLELDNLDDRWQKLSFTFYTMIAKHQSLVSAVLDRGEAE